MVNVDMYNLIVWIEVTPPQRVVYKGSPPFSLLLQGAVQILQFQYRYNHVNMYHIAKYTSYNSESCIIYTAYIKCNDITWPVFFILTMDPTGRCWDPISWSPFASAGFPWRGLRCILWLWSYSHPHTGLVRIFWLCLLMLMFETRVRAWELKGKADRSSETRSINMSVFAFHHFSLHTNELNHRQYINRNL